MDRTPRCEALEQFGPIDEALRVLDHDSPEILMTGSPDDAGLAAELVRAVRWNASTTGTPGSPSC